MIISKYPFAAHLLLTNEENKPMAVISCYPNEDLTEKVALAIQEDLTSDVATNVAIKNDYTIEYDDIDFTAQITDEDNEIVNFPFSLTKIAVYN